MDSYNTEHYKDKTAQKAIRNIEREEKERLSAAIRDVKQVLWLRGFEYVGRIVLIDMATGKIYR